jgi:TRAP-type C4-dicarboxylate transport system permease small subunit
MLSQVITGIRMLVNGIIICLYAFMCIAILAQVIGRYVFDFSIGSAVESATFAQVWMVLLGAGVAMRMNMHNSMDMIAQTLSKPVYRLLIVISAAACLWFLAVTVQGSLPLLEIGEFQTSAALQIPMLVPYIAIPVGCTYFALEIVLFTLDRWRAGEVPELTIEQIEANG